MQGCLGIQCFLAGVFKGFFGLLNQLALTITFTDSLPVMVDCWEDTSSGVSSESTSRQLHTSKTVLLALKYNVFSSSCFTSNTVSLLVYSMHVEYATCQVMVCCVHVCVHERREGQRENCVKYSRFSNLKLVL